MELGGNPQDTKIVQSVIKENDTKIKVLKKNFKILAIDHVHT